MRCDCDQGLAVTGVLGDAEASAERLGTVAVEFDLVYPLRKIRQFRSRAALCWLDELGLKIEKVRMICLGGMGGTSARVRMTIAKGKHRIRFLFAKAFARPLVRGDDQKSAVKIRTARLAVLRSAPEYRASAEASGQVSFWAFWSRVV
jgi:hypothetical protein